MAQLNQAFDATQHDPIQEYQPLPEGEYIAMVVDSDIKATKAGTGTYLSLTIEIVDGEYQGRKVFENLNLDNPSQQTVEIANRTLSAICHAIGKLNVVNSEELHNIPFMAKVGFQKNDPSRNEVKSYKALDGSAPVAAAPAPNATQQAASAPAPAKKAAPWGKQ